MAHQRSRPRPATGDGAIDAPDHVHPFIKRALQDARDRLSANSKRFRKYRTGVFRNTVDDVFLAIVLFFACLAVWATSVLMLVSRYPDESLTYWLYIGSVLTGVAIYIYIKKTKGCLMLNASGVVYIPRRGLQVHSKWREVSKISACAGWMRIYDAKGKKLFSYIYSPVKHRALINLITHYTKDLERLAQDSPDTAPRAGKKAKVEKQTKQTKRNSKPRNKRAGAKPVRSTKTKGKKKKAGKKQVAR